MSGEKKGYEPMHGRLAQFIRTIAQMHRRDQSETVKPAHLEAKEVEHIPLAEKIANIPSEERQLLQPGELIERFVENWRSQGRDENLLEKILAEIHVVDRSHFQKGLGQIVEQIRHAASQGPTLVVTTFVGESGGKIARSDAFAPVRAMVANGELLGLVTDVDDLHNMTDQIPDGTTVIVYDDSSYSGAHMNYPLKELRNLGKKLTIKTATVAVSKRAIENMHRYGADDVWAAYRIPSPSEVFTEADKKLLEDYYGYSEVDEHWENGIYGALSHKVPDNFMKIFNFASEGYRDEKGEFHYLRLLDTHGLYKSAYKGGPRIGEVGLYID